MTDPLRKIHLLTCDGAFRDAARKEVQSLGGWEFAPYEDADSLANSTPGPGDVILLDHLFVGRNVYEICRQLTGEARCQTFVVTDADNPWAEPIAHFCGATGALRKPLRAEDLRGSLANQEPRSALPRDSRGSGSEAVLPEALLRDLSGTVNTGLVDALTDPDTNLFNYAFLNYKIDEEFKRAQRFNHPLSCLMLGFEGEASEEVLRELASIFLQASRDTDILGRFDEHSFLFLLPNTGPDGAIVAARRVGELAEARNLRDVVGDALKLSVGISFHPHPEVKNRDDLFRRVREAFLAARRTGGGLVSSGTERV